MTKGVSGASRPYESGADAADVSSSAHAAWAKAVHWLLQTCMLCPAALPTSAILALHVRISPLVRPFPKMFLYASIAVCTFLKMPWTDHDCIERDDTLKRMRQLPQD